jgi:hypothetical protein
MTRSEWNATLGLTPEALVVLNEIGQDMRLAVSRLSGDAKLIRDPRLNLTLPEHTVSPEIVKELIAKRLISELTEFTDNCKLGWREMGLPGEAYHLYACTQ